MLIRQSAFLVKRPMLKGNLHCHTTLSDGQCSPTVVTRMFADAGYDFLAITDHSRYNAINYAPDTGLLIIPGSELGRRLGGRGSTYVHIVALGRERENGFSDGQMLHYKTGGNAADCQDMLDDMLAAGNIPVFCHPEASGNTLEDLLSLHGYGLIEVYAMKKVWSIALTVILIFGLCACGVNADQEGESGSSVSGISRSDQTTGFMVGYG